MVDLSMEFLGVRFKNPIVAAAGPTTWSLNNLRRCIEAGVSAITPKSTILDADRWERPARRSLFFLDKYDRSQVFTHCSRWFHSPDQAAKLVGDIKPLAQKEGVVVIGNIQYDPPPEGLDDKALISAAKQLEEAGADMLELVVGCPTTRALDGFSPEGKVVQDKKIAKFVLNTLKGKVGIPYYVKMRYDDPAGFLELLKTIGTETDACHIQPQFLATFIDIETGKPVVPMTQLYGRFNTGVSSFFTANAVKNTRLQIMTSGGLWTWRDVVECLMCGATLTAVHTAVLYKGYELFTQMQKGLSDFMERKGYKKIDDFRGIAVPHIDNPQELGEWVKLRQVPAESVKIVVDDTRCNGCGICTVCNAGAITVKKKVAQINLELCERCGLCASICPSDAILLS